ncbi:MAG: hypothetical protein QXH26_01535 [Candidatus Hadarchaeales archaeon]
MLEEKGVSVVVEAVLVLAVVIPAILYTSLTYQNHALHEMEAKHLEEVKTAFLQLQTAAERLQPGGTATVPLSLGGEPVPSIIPFLPFVVGRTAGGTIQFDNSWGRLLFRSQNYRYPDMEIIYENGAILLVQEGEALMLSPPAALAVRENEVYHQVFELEGENFRISGTGVLSLTLICENLLVSENLVQSGENLTIEFHSPAEDAWTEYLLVENSWLAARGYSPTLENLKLILPGPLHYFKRVYRMRVRVGS